jgi:hypothetical protein
MISLKQNDKLSLGTVLMPTIANSPELLGDWFARQGEHKFGWMAGD